MKLTEGINLIGDGLLDISQDKFNGLLVQDDINEIYDIEQTPFARGKFAAVRRAIHKKSGVHFAAKFLKRRRRAQSSDKEIKHEIAVLMLCSDSDNIVKLNAVHESKSDTALLLELATGGELQQFLDNEGSLTEAQTRICMREVLKALQFLHKRSIAHLDLKPQNILLTGQRIEDGLKLCDFGISRVIESGSKVREILGTPDYVAPEVLQYEPLSLQTDIWSVGVLAYVLLSGFSPFGGDTKQETFLNISQCSLTFPDDLFEGVSEHAIDFIKSTLRIKPNDRLTALECLEHIWLGNDFQLDKPFCNNASMTTNDIEEPINDTLDYSNTANKSITNTCTKYSTLNHEIQDNNSSFIQEIDENCDDNNKENISIATNSTYVQQQNGISSIHQTNSFKYNNRRDITSSPIHENEHYYEEKVVKGLNCSSSTLSSSTPNGTGNNNNLTLFPDAPTTPKVIRKTPDSSSPTSVKALVKKFQLDSSADSIVSNSPPKETEIFLSKNGTPTTLLSPIVVKNIENTNTSSTKDAASDLLTNGLKFITSSLRESINGTTNYVNGSADLENSSSPAFANKTTCVFCLTSCRRNGCRHSTTTATPTPTIQKTSQNLGLDQGIIC